MGVCNVLLTVCEAAFENLFSVLKSNRWVGDFQVATSGGFWVATRATWPETFSYTLTESIAANVPPIVTNMGALAERVSADEIGWLVDYKNVGGIRDLILRLSVEKGEIEQYKKRLTTVKLKTTAEMHQEYVALYDSLSSDSKYRNRAKSIKRSAGDLLENKKNAAFGKYIRLKLIFINSIFFRAKNKVIRLFSNL